MKPWFSGWNLPLVHCKDLRWYFLESEAFNLYTAQSVQISIFIPYMHVFLIDNWNLNKQDKQIKFLRQAVSISGEIVPLD